MIATLQHLVGSGDKVDRIEGIFSGTLSFIFNTLGTGGHCLAMLIFNGQLRQRSSGVLL